MKRFLVISGILFAFIFSIKAQVNPHALGIRLGGGDFVGGEVSYQQGLSSSNRLEFDLGIGGNSRLSNLYLSGIYHWNWNLTDGLNWYVGPGATVGLYNYDNDGRINLALGGQIGLEYDFSKLDVPLLVSLDTRPMWNFVGSTGFGWGVALGVRYIW